MSRIGKAVLSTSLCVLLVSALVPLAWAEDILTPSNITNNESITNNQATEETSTMSTTVDQETITSDHGSEEPTSSAAITGQGDARVDQASKEAAIETVDNDSKLSNENTLQNRKQRQYRHKTLPRLHPAGA